jgi:hypothetical protein
MRRKLILFTIPLMIIATLVFFSGCIGTPTAVNLFYSSNVKDLEVEIGDEEATLSWEEPLDPNFDHVEIWYGTGGTADTRYEGPLDPTGTVVTGLSNDVPCTFVVKAVDVNGKVSEGTVSSVTPTDLPPAEVTGLEATAENGQVYLQWNDPDAADLSHIEITYGETTVTVEEGVQESLITGLVNGTTYSITVSAVDNAGHGSELLSIEVTPVDTAGPAEVANIQTAVGDGEVTVSWTNPADEDFDHCVVTYTPGGETPVDVAGFMSSVIVSGLENGSEYTFTIKTVDESDNESGGVNVSVSLPEPVETVNDTGSVYAGKSVLISAANLLSNDTNNLNDEPLEVVSVGSAVNGTVSLEGVSVTFTSTGSAGVDAGFTYTARIQGTSTQAEGYVTLTVRQAPSVIANADTTSVQQGGEVYILVSDLLSNDEGSSLSFVSYGSPVNGTVSKSGDTITFTSTGLAYQPAQFEYTIQDGLATEAAGVVYVEVTPLSPIEAYIYHDSDALAAKLDGYVPPSVSDIFNSWGRFDGNNFYENKDDPSISRNAEAWQFLTDPDRVSMPLNVYPYNGFVSPEQLENYTLEATLTSPNGDDDTIGLVIAFVRIDGINYSLTAIRNQAGTTPSVGWGVCYGEGSSYYSWILDSKTVGQTSHTWSGKQTRVKVQREGDLIKVYCTPWNEVDSYDATSEIVIDLTSDPRLEKFRGAQSYGYTTYSQPDSTYLDIQLGGALDVSKVYDAASGEVWEYVQGSGWTMLESTVQEELGYVRMVTNPETGDTYLIKENVIVLQ